MGRTSKLSGLNQSHLEKLCKAGWTNQQIADFIGISLSTLNRWIARFPGLTKQVRDWKDEADARVERSCYESAIGYDHPEEKIFIHNKKVIEYDESGNKIRESDVPEIIRVDTVRHYPPNPTSIIWWLSNRKHHDWKRTRQEAGADPLSVKVFNIMQNSNGKNNGKKKRDEGPQTAVHIERGLQVVD